VFKKVMCSVEQVPTHLFETLINRVFRSCRKGRIEKRMTILHITAVSLKARSSRHKPLNDLLVALARVILRDQPLTSARPIHCLDVARGIVEQASQVARRKMDLNAQSKEPDFGRVRKCAVFRVEFSAPVPLREIRRVPRQK
jgi:hypothetical protein